ncbi:glycine reductase [Dethiosulfatibacter aminovorans DSM 17477]|nr:glycine reductase [Dethiosulfatibacter aminovorans DSM 17477]
MAKLRVVHYINQFYAGIGGEEKADYKPESREGAVGPGLAFTAAFKDEAEIVATVVCGDSYYNENMEEARKEILDMVKAYSPDLFIAGPAFNAGRYGMACGDISSLVQEELGIKSMSGMYIENPGADIYKKKIYIVETKNSAADMRKAVKKMAALALKLGKEETILSPEKEGYMKRGLRKNIFEDKRGSERAVDMLIRKMKKEEFVTEFPMPVFDRVSPSPAIKNMAEAKIAIVTSGGIVPKGNPDHIESSSASLYGKYDISKFSDLTCEDHETAHGGYDPSYANQDADRVIPVDILREMESEGRIGKLHDYFYTTTGNGTAVASAKSFAAEIARELVADGVNAVILTST